MVRGYSHQNLLLFLFGSGSHLLPPVVPPFAPGNQPTDEKALGFPGIVGFLALQSSQPIEIFGEHVDETTQ